jgi:peptidoglycan biosynthesis protein MviN/MurJ (putative lipid II flippase)
LIAAVANVALAFALIAPYGAIGAACANSLAQVIVAVPLIVYLGRKLGGIEFPWWTFAKGTIAVSVATVAAWGATQELPLAASFVAAPIIYAAITLVLGRLFGVLRPEDRAWLASVARGTMLRRPRLRRAAGVTG